MNQEDRIQIECALEAVAQADRFLNNIALPEDDEHPPWVAAHFGLFMSMCLLIDSLDGVEEATFSSEDRVPVARTPEPYSYLSEKCRALSEKYGDYARENLAAEDDAYGKGIIRLTSHDLVSFSARRFESGGFTAERMARAACSGVPFSLGIGFGGRPRGFFCATGLVAIGSLIWAV